MNIATRPVIDKPDYTAIKSKQQITWGSGDYSRVGVTLQKTGEDLCEAMDMRSGQSVLDVAAGNGNVTLAAARRFCKVVSTDYVASLLEDSARRAEAEGLSVTYRQADAEALPFDDASFDNVVSTFGVMFAPDQARVAEELVRVCRPGGRIGMANWTPGGFIGRLFEVIGGYVTPPAGVSSPANWGDEVFLDANFTTRTKDVHALLKQFTFRYHSPAHWLDVFGTYYGPVLKAFETLGEDKGEKLRTDILALIDEFNLAEDGTMVVPSDYLEVVIDR